MGHLRYSGLEANVQRQALIDIIASDPVLMQFLRGMRELGLPDPLLGSGAIYNTVWNVLTGRPRHLGIKDADVVYFDPADRSYGLTLLVIAVGYGVHRLTFLGRLRSYIETVSLSFSVLLLLVPTVTETLTRVPDGAPFASSVSSPIVLGAHATLLVAFIVGLIAQIIVLRREGRARAAA